MMKLVQLLGRKPLSLLGGVRCLYSASVLGVDGYVKTRENVKTQFRDIEDKFKLKMNDFTDSETNMVFTEDLKNMVHLADSSESDLELVKKMMLKFSLQNKDLRFGSFVFGPVVMRMYYYLDKPAEALAMFKQPELNGFFDQLMSYQILMDLLLKHGMYTEVIEVFDVVKGKQFQGAKYPKNSVVLVFAACYQLNTPESFDYSKKLWSELTQSGHLPMRRAGTFAAGLAIRQGAPHVALEILTSMRHQNYVTVRNLKVAALADLGRPDDAFPIFRTILEGDSPGSHTQARQSFYQEVVDKMKSSLDRVDRKELKETFEKMEAQLLSLGYVNQAPLSELLTSEITLVADPKSTERRGPFVRNKYTLRPGLQDLV